MQIRYVLFVIVAVAINIAGHRYLHARLIRDPDWSPRVRRVGLVAAYCLAFLMALATPLSFLLPELLSRWAFALGFAWMGIAFYLFFTCALSDVLRRLDRIRARFRARSRSVDGSPEDPSRRLVLARATTQLVGLSTVGLSAAAFRGGFAEIEVKEVGVKLARLPPALSGMTLVQLTDLHIGHVMMAGFVEEVVDRANRLRADAVVITGDLVDGSVERLRPLLAPLTKLVSRWGTFFVTGNHEYYSGAVAWEAELIRMGIRVLRNERIELSDGTCAIDLAGIDDYSAGAFGFGHGSDLAKACLGRDEEREVVLLAHQPRSIHLTEGYKIGLQISGHTHGGQMWPLTHVYPAFMDYVRGLYRHDGETQIYVSCGTGYWGPPMRLAAPSEITKIILAPAG